ncbi:hypothetical protein ABPG77_009883 [Micractinium sp. CCAP 211/92]
MAFLGPGKQHDMSPMHCLHLQARGRAASATPGLSAEQQAFLARKAAESRSPAPAAAPARGRSSSARPSFRASSPARPSSRPTAAAPSYSAPAPAAANGLSAEQQAFLARKAQESRSPAPAAAPARGRSSSARPSFRASSPSRPAAAPAAANGLSAEQQAFLARKAQESRSPAPAAPARGRSSSARPSFRASAPVSNSGVRSAMSSSSSSSPSAYGASSYKFVTADEQAKLSKEQVGSARVTWGAVGQPPPPLDCCC